MNDPLMRLAQLSLLQGRDVKRDRSGGKRFVQGNFVCPGCERPIRFYVGNDNTGPKRCSDHQGVRP